jgi:hypothetical protein
VALLAYNVALETSKKAGKSFVLRKLGEKTISPRSNNGRTESFEKTLFKAADKLKERISTMQNIC